MDIQQAKDKVMQASQYLSAERLRTILLLLCTLWLLSMLADTFWRLVPEPQASIDPYLLIMKGSSGVNSSQKQEAAYVDIERMQSWHLFGHTEKQELIEPEEITEQASESDMLDAKETKLRLKLLGLMRSSVEEASYAVIEANNKADLYRVKQAIPVGQNIKLAKVLSDRVIIDNRGSLEALLLYDENERSVSERNVQVNQAASSTGAQTIDQRRDRRITAMASSYRERLLNNPMSLADVISISMARDSDGNILGYSVRPGRDRRQFSELGLRSGDVVTSVNGISLQDPSGAMEIYNHLSSAKEASLSIKRGSEDVVILVNLSE